MKVLLETDLAGFADLGLLWALRDPVVNNVLTTQAEAVRNGRRTYDDALWITVLDRGGEVVGAAMHTPPYYLFLCPMPAPATLALASALAPVQPGLAGVTGESATAEDFVSAWRGLTGASALPGTSSRLYRLDSVIAPDTVPGRLRTARGADRELLVAWTEAFISEAMPRQPADDVPTAVGRVLVDGGGFVWEIDDIPVSYAVARPPAAGVARIGPVYTPPAHRRRGYAGACVAAVSQRTLEAGAAQCALYTDLSNPTSNGVYQRLGYRPVADSQEYAFTY